MSQDEGPNRRQNDGKGPMGGQNFLWYMAGAVLLITVGALYLANLNVAVIDYPDLVKLIQNSKHIAKYEPLEEGMSGDVIVQRKGTNGTLIRDGYSNLRDVTISDRTVTGTIDYQRIVPPPSDPKPQERSFRRRRASR